jgi:two-component system, LuxR family, response regulator FixJ
MKPDKENLHSIIYVVDDEVAVRDSLCILLESSGHIVRSFESAASFLENYHPDYPGCLILDVRMPGMNGLDLQQELIKRQIKIPIIFMSGHAEIPDSARAFRAGAIDFLEKPFDKALFLERIQEAISKDIDNRKKWLEIREIQQRIERLTSREKEVLDLIVENHSNKEVARILAISPRTIDVHRARIMQKMEADNYTDLLTMVLQNNVLNKNLHH